MQNHNFKTGSVSYSCYHTGVKFKNEILLFFEWINSRIFFSDCAVGNFEKPVPYNNSTSSKSSKHNHNRFTRFLQLLGTFTRPVSKVCKVVAYTRQSLCLVSTHAYFSTRIPCCLFSCPYYCHALFNNFLSAFLSMGISTLIYLFILFLCIRNLILFCVRCYH